MARGRQRQLKQIWLRDDDVDRFERIAKALEAEGEDVRPDNRRANEEFSHTKVFRLLMLRAEPPKK